MVPHPERDVSVSSTTTSDRAPHPAAPDSPAAPLTGAPACPVCGGRMWDNRASKRNPRAPDFKCRDRSCDGVLWPGQHSAAVPILTPRRELVRADASPELDTEPHAEPATESPAAETPPAVSPLRRCYLDLTDFVLGDVRARYERAGVPCTDATVAAIVATLFIATCKKDDGRSRGGAA